MRAYVGQTRSHKWIEMLTGYGIGECTTRKEVPPKRQPWFFDNGAFADFQAGRQFDDSAYEYALKRIETLEGPPPDFAVVPDIVGGGRKSLEFSDAWLDRCRAALPEVAMYLAVQPGQDASTVAKSVQRGGYAGLLIGGDVSWKLRTGAKWRTLTRALGIACHVGRAGTMKRVLWARQLEMDSIDSSLPLWSHEHLRRFVDALKGWLQLPLPGLSE